MFECSEICNTHLFCACFTSQCWVKWSIRLYFCLFPCPSWCWCGDRNPSVMLCRLVSAHSSSVVGVCFVCSETQPAAAFKGSWAGYQLKLLSWTEWDYMGRPGSSVSGSLLHLETCGRGWDDTLCWFFLFFLCSTDDMCDSSPSLNWCDWSCSRVEKASAFVLFTCCQVGDEGNVSRDPVQPVVYVSV